MKYIDYKICFYFFYVEVMDRWVNNLFWNVIVFGILCFGVLLKIGREGFVLILFFLCVVFLVLFIFLVEEKEDGGV